MPKPGYFDYQRAMPTLWGKADYVTHLERGVVWVGTPSHGGLMVGKAVARKRLSPEAQEVGELCGSWLCYEEDCAYAVPLYENPQWALMCQFVVPPTVAQLEDVLKNWHPDYYERHTGRHVPDGESYIRRSNVLYTHTEGV